jgi:Na+/H+ antiporter NhaC
MLILVAFIFIALGIAIKYGKMYFLIAGYNTMPKEKQQQYNIDGIASVFRNAMFGMTLILILGHLLSKIITHENLEVFVLFGALMIGLPYLLIVSNSSKYKIK